MKQVVVFGYGFGNVRSMVCALAYIGLDVILTSDHVRALKADGLVVLGVGAFAACMDGIRASGGAHVVRVLAVCSGSDGV